MEVSAKVIDLIVEEIKKRGTSYDEIARLSLLSKSTISRVMTQKRASPFTIKQLVAYLEIGDKYRAVMGDDAEPMQGCQIASEMMMELAAVRNEWSQRLDDTVANYENRITFYQQQMLSVSAEREREREDQKSMRQHLKTQITRLQDNNTELLNRLVATEAKANKAELRAEKSEGKRHSMFWGMLVVIIGLCIALIIALSTDRIF